MAGSAHLYPFAMVDTDLDNNPKIRRAGRDGREVFQFVLRRNRIHGATGSIPVDEIEPWYLADRLMAPEGDMSRGVTACVTSGLLAIDGDRVMICGWDDSWDRRPKSDAERKQKQRDRSRESRDVTPGHAGHESHALEKNREEKNRSEKKNKRGAASPSPAPEFVRVKAEIERLHAGKNNGAKPTPSKRADDRVRALIKLHGEAKVLEHATALFVNTPNWVKPPVTVGTLFNLFDSLRPTGEVQGAKSGRVEPQQASAYAADATDEEVPF